MSTIRLRTKVKDSTPAATTEAPATEAIKPSFVFDKDKLLQHLDSVESQMLDKYAGKPGVNPFIWIRQHLRPLRAKLAAGVATESLHDQVMQVKVEKL